MFLNSFFWNPQVSEPCQNFTFVRRDKPVGKEKGETWKVSFLIVKLYIRMDTAIACGVNSVLLLCSFGILPQYIFPPFVYHKVNFQRPNHFFSHKMLCISFMQLLSKEHSKELLEAAFCLSTLIWNNIMTADRWSEHGLSFHRGTSEVFLNKFNTSKLRLDTGKRGNHEDFIEFDKSQSAMTGLLSRSTSQTAAPVGCSL